MPARSLLPPQLQTCAFATAMRRCAAAACALGSSHIIFVQCNFSGHPDFRVREALAVALKATCEFMKIKLVLQQISRSKFKRTFVKIHRATRLRLLTAMKLRFEASNAADTHKGGAMGGWLYMHGSFVHCLRECAIVVPRYRFTLFLIFSDRCLRKRNLIF